MRENDWVPAHRRLFKGAKKSLPRATRFILLELCHEARPTDGVLEFPPEWDTVTATHDRIGGNRKELRVALQKLQELDSDGFQVIQIERDETKHRLIIVKWETWRGPKSAAERIEDYRKRKVTNSIALQESQSVTPIVEESIGKENRVEEKSARAREGTAAPGGSEIPSQDHATFAAMLKSLPKLCDLDIPDLADLCVQRMIAGAKIEWVLKSLQDANDKSQRGELAHIRHGRVVAFVGASKRPKQDLSAPRSETRILSVTYDKPGMPAGLSRLVGGIGTGPK